MPCGGVVLGGLLHLVVLRLDLAAAPDQQGDSTDGSKGAG